MRICVVQFDVSKDVFINIKKVENFISQNDARVYVLPELSERGYLFNDRGELFNISSSIDENIFVNKLKQISKDRGCSIIAGVLEKENNELYNSAVIIDKGINIGVYRKIHLSDFEKTLFDPGKSNKVFDIDGIKIGIQVCFDLWFPEMSREQILQGADILCVLANFGSETTYDISRIRAIENITPVVLCNRVGKEKNSKMDAYFLGRSTVIDSSGKRLIIGTDNIENSEACDIEIVKNKGNIICNDFIKEINLHGLKVNN